MCMPYLRKKHWKAAKTPAIRRGFAFPLTLRRAGRIRRTLSRLSRTLCIHFSHKAARTSFKGSRPRPSNSDVKHNFYLGETQAYPTLLAAGKSFLRLSTKLAWERRSAEA